MRWVIGVAGLIVIGRCLGQGFDVHRDRDARSLRFFSGVEHFDPFDVVWPDPAVRSL